MGGPNIIILSKWEPIVTSDHCWAPCPWTLLQYWGQGLNPQGEDLILYNKPIECLLHPKRPALEDTKINTPWALQSQRRRTREHCLPGGHGFLSGFSCTCLPLFATHTVSATLFFLFSTKWILLFYFLLSLSSSVICSETSFGVCPLFFLIYFIFFVFLSFLGPHPPHMEVPRLEVRSEL